MTDLNITIFRVTFLCLFPRVNELFINILFIIIMITVLPLYFNIRNSKLKSIACFITNVQIFIHQTGFFKTRAVFFPFVVFNFFSVHIDCIHTVLAKKESNEKCIFVVHITPM